MVLHATISGRVQGVGFRYWVLQEANKLDLRGWVRNTHHGEVEVEAEGNEDVLFEFEQVLWRGPALSRVDQVDCQYLKQDKDYTAFRITH